MNWIRSSKHSRTGIKLVDRDHDHLAEILAEIQLRTAAGFASGQTGAIVRKLAERMRLHFILEEGMMRATRYPGAALHRLRHKWLMDQVNLLARRRRQEGIDQNVELVELLADAHHGHVGGEDLDYGLWLESSGPRGGEEPIPEGGRMTRMSVAHLEAD